MSRVDVLSRRWGGPEGGPDGMAVAAAYLAHTLEALGHTVRRLPGPIPDFTADLTITTLQPQWRRAAQAAQDAGACNRIVYWHHHGGLQPDYGCLQAGALASGAPIILPPSSWAVEAGGECTGSDILVPGAGAEKGAHVARQVAERCPDLRWYVLRGRCSNEDVAAWRPLAAEVAPGEVSAASFLARARAVLAPTRFETYGLTLVEAAVRGIPVVCTDLPGTRAALGDSAIFVPIDAAPSIWAFALQTALASPLPRLVLPPYREVVAAALEQLQHRRAA